MIIVNSYIRRGGECIPICSCDGLIGDSDYIEGVVEIQINGKMLITKDMWDYVDQLWSYLIQGLTRLSQGENFSTYFPDQPIHLTFSRELSAKFVTVEIICDGVTSARADYVEFAKVLSGGAKLFFVKMLELAPKNRDAYEAILDQITSLEQQLPQ